jgi:hypothetical protein
MSKPRILVLACLFSVAPLIIWLAAGPEIPEGTFFLISQLDRLAMAGDPSNIIYSFARAPVYALLGPVIAAPAAFLLAGFLFHAILNAAIFTIAYQGIRLRSDRIDAGQAWLVALLITLLIYPLASLTHLAGQGTTLIPHDIYHTFSLRTPFWLSIAMAWLLLLHKRYRSALWVVAASSLIHPSAGILAFGCMTLILLAHGWRNPGGALLWHWLGAALLGATPTLLKLLSGDAAALHAPIVTYADWYSSMIKDEADDFSFLFQLLYRSKAVAVITALIGITLVLYARVFPDFRRHLSFWCAAAVPVLFFGGALLEYLFAVLVPTPAIHLLVTLTPGYRLLSFAFFPLLVLGARLADAGMAAIPANAGRAPAALIVLTWSAMLATGIYTGNSQAAVQYARWALQAGTVTGIDAYLAAARSAGHSRYNEPPLFRDGDAVVLYPGERNLFRIHRLDRQQPQLPADSAAAEHISEANFLALTAAIRERLPAGAGIIIPPYLRYFRDTLVDYRIFLQEHHDGNLMMGSPAFLGFWQERMRALMGLDYEHLPSKVSGLNFTVMRRAYVAIDSAAAAALAARYPEYRYFVTERGHRLDFAIIIGNDGFLVYDLLQPAHTGAAID